MSQPTASRATAFVLIAIALCVGAWVWFDSRRPGPDAAAPSRDGARGAGPVVRDATPRGSASDATEIGQVPEPAAAPSEGTPAATPDKGVPAAEPPKFPYSYLAGKTPSEVLPDGTQIFRDVPFQVRQPDGTMAVQMSTITITPTTPLPVEAEPGSK